MATTNLDPGPLRLGGVPEHFNLPWHLAMDSPATDGLELEWSDQFGGTGEMLAGLADGSLDIVSILTEGSISAIAGGLDVTIMQVYVSSPLEWGVFVPASSSLTTEDELGGRPIAISRLGSGSHLIAYIHAEAKQWPITEDQFVVTGGLEGARKSFAAGESEVFLWDRFMTKPLVDAGEFRQVGIFPTPWPSFVIAARTEILTGRTADVGRVVDAVVAEATALHARPSIVEEIMSRYGLDSETTKGWLASTTFAPRQAMDPHLGENVLVALRKAGFASG